MKLRLATMKDKPELGRLLEVYLRELSAYGPVEMPYRFFDAYWQEPGRRWPYLFGEGDGTAGFAFVRLVDGSGSVFEMAEFCVLPEQRRRGVGVAAARAVFKRHPGSWSLGVLRENEAGRRFWAGVLGADPVRDVVLNESDMGSVYRFAI